MERILAGRRTESRKKTIRRSYTNFGAKKILQNAIRNRTRPDVAQISELFCGAMPRGGHPGARKAQKQ
jgi:hypothetical protein